MILTRGWQRVRRLFSRQPLPEDREPILHGESGIRQVGHREYVGGLWDQLGRLQFDFLVAQGLRPHHYLLDVGCGCLRGGVHFIGYLEPGHYCGLEKEPLLLEAGLRDELPAGMRETKRPRLHLTADFDCIPFAVPLDFGLAQSLFTHLPAGLVRTCLARIRPAFRPGGVFFATFFETGREQLNPALPHDHGYFAYTRRQMEDLGRHEGWRPEHLGEWGHPRGQRMMRFIA
jgi:hypothetical protein